MLFSVIAAALLSMDPCATVPVAPPPGGSRLHDTDLPLRTTVFVNFNGGDLVNPFTKLSFEDNSAENISSLVPGTRLTIPPYTGGEQLAIAAVQAAEVDLAPFGIRVVYLERPAKRLPYTMLMFGGDAALLELDLDYGGFAPIDCELGSLRHIGFVFNDESADAARQGNTISHEAGHTLGLDHALGDDEIMSYTGDTDDKVFTDECRDFCIAECLGGAIVCPDRHAEFCPAGQQNAVAELQHFFGTGAPDTEPPQVAFITPAEGDNFRAGAGIRIEAELSDDFGGFGWELRIERNGKVVYDAPDYSGVPTWFLQNAKAGTYELTLTVEDHADHVVEQTLSFTVGTMEEEHDATTSGEGSTTDAPASTGSSDGSSESTGMVDLDVPLDDDGSCGCRSGRRLPAFAWLVALLWLRRRK